MDWILVIFTMMEPSVSPSFQNVPVPSQSVCYAMMDRLSIKFEATEGLIFSLECKVRKMPVEKKDEVVPDPNPI